MSSMNIESSDPILHRVGIAGGKAKKPKPTAKVSRKKSRKRAVKR